MGVLFPLHYNVQQYSRTSLIRTPKGQSEVSVKFTRVNKMEAIYERPGVNVTVERGSTFTFTRDPPQTLHCLYLIYARKIYVRTHAKITLQWKSTLRETQVLMLAQGRGRRAVSQKRIMIPKFDPLISHCYRVSMQPRAFAVQKIKAVMEVPCKRNSQ